MGWLSAFSALARLFDSLSGLYRDWRLRRAGAKEARLSALEAAQRRSKRRVEIEKLKLLALAMMLSVSGCANIDAPAAGCDWVRPIILTEDDRLTVETMRALLAHNEAVVAFCGPIR